MTLDRYNITQSADDSRCNWTSHPAGRRQARGSYKYSVNWIKSSFVQKRRRCSSLFNRVCCHMKITCLALKYRVSWNTSTHGRRQRESRVLCDRQSHNDIFNHVFIQIYTYLYSLLFTCKHCTTSWLYYEVSLFWAECVRLKKTFYLQ